MDKQSLILKYFQKSDQLTTKNTEYCSTITSIFKWLVENDKVHHDRTTKFFNFSSRHKAQIICHDDAVAAGIEELNFLLLNHTNLIFHPIIKDGERASKEQVIAEIEGSASEILSYERTILNILQRLSGIATETNHLIHIIELQPTTYNLKPYLTATRKTPWMMLDKKAVSVAGGLTHRLSLADGILIKDNHLAAIKKEHKLKTIKEAISKAMGMVLKKMKGELVEVEVETEKEALAVLSAFRKYNTDNYLALMFDNFSPAFLLSVLSDLGNLYGLSSVIFEASGGIDKSNIGQWSKTGVDLISIGGLTHSPSAVNISLEL